MKRRILFVALAVLVVMGAAAALSGCSKDKGTNPVTTPPVPESFDSGTLTGTPFTHTFNTAGTYGYRCVFHGGAPYYMTGTVVVDGASLNTSASVNVTNFTFSPASVTVKPGSTVTWTLGSGMHSVTRP